MASQFTWWWLLEICATMGAQFEIIALAPNNKPHRLVSVPQTKLQLSNQNFVSYILQAFSQLICLLLSSRFCVRVTPKWIDWSQAKQFNLQW